MEEKISELLKWTASNKDIKNLWGDALREDIATFLARGMSVEEVKQQLIFLDEELDDYKSIVKTL